MGLVCQVYNHREKIVTPVFSSIEEQLGRETESYYAVLAQVGEEAWSPNNDCRPWLRFCLNAHYRQAQLVLGRIQEIEELWGRCERLVDDKGLPERAVGSLCDASRGLRIYNWIYRLAVEESYGDEIDPATASRDLRAIVASGLLEPRGETRGRFYVATKDLLAERTAVRARYPIGRRSVDLFQDKGVSN